MSNFKTEIMEKLFKLVNESKLDFSYSLDNNELKLVIKFQEEKPVEKPVEEVKPVEKLIEEVKPVEEPNIDVYHLDYLINGLSESDSDSDSDEVVEVEVKPIKEQKKKNKKPLWQYSVKLGWYQRQLLDMYNNLSNNLKNNKINKQEYDNKIKQQQERTKSFFKHYPKFQKYEERFNKMDEDDIMNDKDYMSHLLKNNHQNKYYVDLVYNLFIINDNEGVCIDFSDGGSNTTSFFKENNGKLNLSNSRIIPGSSTKNYKPKSDTDSDTDSDSDSD